MERRQRGGERGSRNAKRESERQSQSVLGRSFKKSGSKINENEIQQIKQRILSTDTYPLHN